VDDGAVGPGAGDRVERQVAKLGSLAAKRLEPVRRNQLVDLALRSFLVDPVEEAGDGDAVALLRFLMAGDFERILACFRKDRRVAKRQDPGIRLLERVEDRRHRPLGIDGDRLAAKLAKSGFELVALVQANAVAEVLAHVRADLFGCDEQIGGAVFMDDRISQSDRRVGDVGPADIECPGDRIERRENCRVGLLLLQPFGDLGALFGRAPARIFVGLDDQPGIRGLGPVPPDSVDRVALDRDKLGAAALECLARFFHPVAGVEPRVVADASALLRMLLQPVGDAGFGYRLVAPVLAVDLRADLKRVAAVDEDRRFLRKHDRRARRTLEAGQPREALSVASDIFAHMLVGQRHDEAVEPVAFQLLAKRGEPVCIAGHGRYLGFRGIANKNALTFSKVTR
jgi:hypothetical protein